MSKSIGSRIGRREQLSQQERLIQQRKREIETKLSQLSDKEVTNDCSDCDKESINEMICELKSERNESEIKSENQTNESQTRVDVKCEEKSSSLQLVNKFKNDGSFFAQFLQMQKTVDPINETSVKSEPQDSKQDIKGIKPIKMVLKENALKLKAISSVEASNVRLSDDDDYKVSPPEDKDIQLAIERTAISVTMNGVEAEENMRQSKNEDNLYSWLKDKESENYKYYEQRVEELGQAKARAQEDGLLIDAESESSTSKGSKRQRKSRWSDERVEMPDDMRHDPSLVQYAIQVFGNTDLTADQWKQLEDQRKMKMLFEMLQKKHRKNEILAKAGKVKYEYDSDEDVDDGTWEHKRRRMEMKETQRLADQLTEKGVGKHHIGDFMPPEELERFLHKWEAFKDGDPLTPDTDYRDSKLQSNNVGFQMLKKLGWVEGQGLGADGTGISDPINKSVGGLNNTGLGQIRPEDLKEGDDEYEAYRKRMMLAYRFRPNPLNNPRRAYY